MHLIIDLIILAIIILNIILSAKNGFVKTLIEVVGFVLAIIVSISLSTPIANFVYDKTVEPTIVNSVTEKAESNVDTAANEIWNSLPKFLKDNAADIGITNEKITQTFESETTDNVKNTALKVSQDVVKPVFVKIVGLAISAILFIILMFIVKLLAKLINGIFSFSIIGVLNRTLGAFLGLGKGILIAIAVCMLISMIVSFTTKGFLIFTKETLDKTYIFNILTNIINR